MQELVDFRHSRFGLLHERAPYKIRTKMLPDENREWGSGQVMPGQTCQSVEQNEETVIPDSCMKST